MCVCVCVCVCVCSHVCQIIQCRFPEDSHRHRRIMPSPTVTIIWVVRYGIFQLQGLNNLFSL